MRYLLFSWECYEARGGADDLVAAFPGVEEAIKAHQCRIDAAGTLGVRAHVLDVITRKVVMEFDGVAWSALA